MEAKVLVVDDEAEMTTLLQTYLHREGYEVNTASSAETALTFLEDHDVDVILTDLHMGEMSGLDLVRAIQTMRPETQVILMTAFGGIETAIEAIKAGAFHFVTKPVALPEVGILLHNALTERELKRENRQLRQAVEEHYRFGQLLGKSAVMQQLFAFLERLTTTESTVLIQGETGTGKELIARALHHNGPRQRQAFVPINCAAMPEGLLESELFGHVKGAFTGADVARSGLFQEAAKGTLFLDEIGEMPLGMQSKLLRVLEHHQIRPVGSDRDIDVDVRILAATHRDLEAEIVRGNFREDLYYRLKVFTVKIPPLRDHPDDIPFLAETFLQRYASDADLSTSRFTRAALKALEQHPWPGNVRELAHVIERAVTLCDREWIKVMDLGLKDDLKPAWQQAFITTFDLETVTQALVVAALKRTRGQRKRAATMLGVHPRTVSRMIRRYGLAESEEGHVRDVISRKHWVALR